jgi:hypothetical protein
MHNADTFVNVETHKTTKGKTIMKNVRNFFFGRPRNRRNPRLRNAFSRETTAMHARQIAANFGNMGGRKLAA